MTKIIFLAACLYADFRKKNRSTGLTILIFPAMVSSCHVGGR